MVGITSIQPRIPKRWGPCRIVLSKEGYFKKITYRSLQGNDEQYFKDGDCLRQMFDVENKDTVLFFTDQGQLYRAAINDFDTCKASVIGDFLPASLKMDSGEKPVFMTVQSEFREGYNYVFLFENGKGVKVPEKAYETSSVRRKLKGVFSTASPIVAVFSENEKKPFEILMISNDDRAIIFKSSLIPVKTTKTSIGVQLMTLKKNQTVVSALADFDDSAENTKGYRKLKLPASGVLLNDKDIKNRQISIDEV